MTQNYLMFKPLSASDVGLQAWRRHFDACDATMKHGDYLIIIAFDPSDIIQATFSEYARHLGVGAHAPFTTYVRNANTMTRLAFHLVASNDAQRQSHVAAPIAALASLCYPIEIGDNYVEPPRLQVWFGGMISRARLITSGRLTNMQVRWEGHGWNVSSNWWSTSQGASVMPDMAEVQLEVLSDRRVNLGGLLSGNGIELEFD